MAKRKRTASETLRPISTSLAEWIAAGLGLLTVTVMIGFLAWYGIRYQGATPWITVELLGTPTAGPGGYQVRYLARNYSGATAAQVRIEGDLRFGNESERSMATLDYLPGHSARQGGLFFRHDPRSGSLELRVTGYQDP